jgi:hypothetical protein
MRETLLEFDGWIAGSAFTRGDMIVVGIWRSSPFGPFVDLMWAAPDGTRTLHAPNDAVGEFVAAHYSFDAVAIAPVSASIRARRVHASAEGIAFELRLGRAGALSIALSLRPRNLRRWAPWIMVEDALVRPLLSPLLGDGIRARGSTRAGWRERYAVHDLRPAVAAHASVAGVDLGPSVARTRGAGFGFSEFPRSPALVRVTSRFEEPRTRRDVRASRGARSHGSTAPAP